MKSKLLLAASFIALAGCSGLHKTSYQIEPGQELHIPVKSCTASSDQTYVLTYEYQKQRGIFLASFSCAGDKITLEGMMPSGAKLFLVEKTGPEFKYQPFVALPRELLPEQILGDFLLATLSAEQLKKVLPSHFTVESNSQERIVRDNGEPVVEVTYHKGVPVTISNVALDHTVRMKALPSSIDKHGKSRKTSA